MSLLERAPRQVFGRYYSRRSSQWVAQFAAVLVLFAMTGRSVAAVGALPAFSFLHIEENQKLSFGVWGAGSKYGIVHFQVSVSSSPKPKAVIRLALSSSTFLDATEHAWGHPVDAPVEKPLSESDLQLLENLLASYRARGLCHDMTLTSPGWMEFVLSENSRPLRKEVYNVTPHKGDPDFIKAFIGFDLDR